MHWTVCKAFTFEAAHKLSDAFTQECVETIHGHSYKVEVFLEGSLNATGMVMDFGLIKGAMKPILKEWDHALILQKGDPIYPKEIEKENAKVVWLDCNPTAENMAAIIYSRLKPALAPLKKVRVWETATAWAEYRYSERR